MSSLPLFPQQLVPKDSIVFEALSRFRDHHAATADAEARAPNSKAILKSLTAENPHWKLTQQRVSSSVGEREVSFGMLPIMQALAGAL